MAQDYYFDPRMAERYDAQHSGRDAIVQDDILFYVELAREAAATGGSVLELGCGTGRVTIPIAQAGVNITGLDNAAPMLDVARRKSQDLTNLRWVQGDMRRFDLAQRFALVIIPFRSFLMLLTTEDQQACLRCIHHHLADGGRLALNIFNPPVTAGAGSLTRPRTSLPSSKNGREVIGYVDRTTANRADRLEDIRGDDAIISGVERSLQMRYVFRQEMADLLTNCAFDVEDVYGWFDRRPFQDDSSEMIWLARRA